MYKLKPSLLESFRIYQSGIFDKPIEDIINSVKGIRKPTDKMNYGSLVHQYLEKGEDKIEFQDKIYQLQELEKQQLSDIMFDDIAKEVSFRFNLNNDILISGKIDGMIGNTGIEYKTSSYPLKIDFYDNSIQWKLYCKALNLQRFVYFHIQIIGTKSPYRFIIKGFSFYPYLGINQDIENLCYEFIDFCKTNNLESFINE